MTDAYFKTPFATKTATTSFLITRRHAGGATVNFPQSGANLNLNALRWRVY